MGMDDLCDFLREKKVPEETIDSEACEGNLLQKQNISVEELHFLYDFLLPLIYSSKYKLSCIVVSPDFRIQDCFFYNMSIFIL